MPQAAREQTGCFDAPRDRRVHCAVAAAEDVGPSTDPAVARSLSLKMKRTWFSAQVAGGRLKPIKLGRSTRARTPRQG